MRLNIFERELIIHGKLLNHTDPKMFLRILTRRQPELAEKFKKNPETYGEPSYMEVGVYILHAIDLKDEADAKN